MCIERPNAAHKTNVPSVQRQLSSDDVSRTRHHSNIIKHVGGHKRIIHGAQEQRWNPDGWNKLETARPGIVVVGSRKPMHGGRYSVVKFKQVPGAQQSSNIEEIGIPVQFRQRLRAERSQEMARVDS